MLGLVFTMLGSLGKGLQPGFMRASQLLIPADLHTQTLGEGDCLLFFQIKNKVHLNLFAESSVTCPD